MSRQSTSISSPGSRDRAEVNQLLQCGYRRLRGLLAYSEAAHASIDFNHDPHSAIIDASQTRVSGGHLLNLFIWFDNEWGFANRLLDVAQHWLLQRSQTGT